MSEFNLYDAVSAALVKQITTYMPQVTVRPESVKHVTPDYPYVTYKIYDDYDRVLFNTVNEEIFDIHVQFKPSQMTKEKLKHLVTSCGSFFCNNQRMTISATSLPRIVTRFHQLTFLTLIGFMSGADYTFGVQDNFMMRRNGKYCSVDPQINTKGAE